ncbi:hypothetical protein KCV00_g413, partial [Aureobasidium melanogenum]
MLRQQLSRPTLQDDRDAFVYAMIELEKDLHQSDIATHLFIICFCVTVVRIVDVRVLTARSSKGEAISRLDHESHHMKTWRREMATKPLYLSSCSARVCLDDCNVLLLAGQFEVSDPTVHRDEPRNMLIQKPSLTYLVTPLV